MSSNRILVIDDDDSIREVAQLALEILGGWQVSTAGGGADGVAKAAAERPDVILLDVMMPDLDGPATLARLRTAAATNDIPVIFLTAKIRPADRARFLGLGAEGVITKPFDPTSLSDEIFALLNGHP